MSITRNNDGNFGNVSAGVCFPKSRINENGGKSIKLITLQNYKVYQKLLSVRSPKTSTYKNDLVRF